MAAVNRVNYNQGNLLNSLAGEHQASAPVHACRRQQGAAQQAVALQGTKWQPEHSCVLHHFWKLLTG